VKKFDRKMAAKRAHRWFLIVIVSMAVLSLILAFD